MMKLPITIYKLHVYQEVAKTSAYAGAKEKTDGSSYVRMAALEEDREMIERFWMEAAGRITTLLQPFLLSIDSMPLRSVSVDIDRNFVITIGLGDYYPADKSQSIAPCIYTYFVNYILYRWYELVGAAERSAASLLVADNQLKELQSKLYYKSAPQRNW